MIYTSYFSNVKGVLGRKPRVRFCSIAGKTPDWFLDLDKRLGLKSFKCRSLMPRYEWWSVWHEKFKDSIESQESRDWYTSKYEDTVLKTLSAAEIAKKLYDESERNDVCLLCYEAPGKFCHRHIVADWFVKNGIDCAEI